MTTKQKLLKKISSILEKQVDMLNSYIDIGLNGRRVRRRLRWHVLETSLRWYKFRLKALNWIDDRSGEKRIS